MLQRMKLRVAVVTVLSLAVVGLQPASPAAAETTSARSMLLRLTVAAEAGSTTYQRTYFKHWVDANGDCQNTRTEVLIAESKVTPTYTSSSRCAVSRGRWYSPYDGKTWTYASDVDIDHFVPLKEGWESGARRWTATNRERFANDLAYGPSLNAMTDNLNSSKADRDPAQWLPPANRCAYARNWVLVKYRWRLSIDSAERSRLSILLSGSCGATTVTVPARAL